MSLHKLIVPILFLASITSISSSANNPIPGVGKSETTKELRKQVANLVQNPRLKEHNILAAEVFIKFTIDDKKEILLLQVKAKNSYLKKFVKERLHNRQLNVKGLEVGTTYNLTISFNLQ